MAKKRSAQAATSGRGTTRKKKPGSKATARRRAPAAKTAKKRQRTLDGVSDIRRFFHQNEEPIYFVSATNFNLLGIDEWVRNFWYINHIDSFDGNHPSTFVPRETEHEPFESIEDINNYLLGHKDVIDFMRSHGKRGKAVFLMFNQRTEELCRQLGLEVCFPKSTLREKIDDKVNTNRIAERAGVPCVPYVLAKVDSYATLRKVSRKLGRDLVIQTPYGDSGHTTFFISKEKDFDKHADEIIEAPALKIMKKIRCRGSALEACVTRHGTIVGPLMTELVGFKELTPYKGGWCGNEVDPEVFSRKVRNQARRSAERFGNELKKMGYRGYFELDFLTDLETGRVYLGECNPRITGASSMTNLAAFAHADAPLFLFHLLEWMGVRYRLNVDELNARWANPDYIDTWSQMVIKHTEDTVDLVTDAPASGIWELEPGGGAKYVRAQTHRRTVRVPNRGFFLRITGPGDYRYEGADLGILVSPGRFMTDGFRLTPRAKSWIDAVRQRYSARPIPRVEKTEAAAVAQVGGFKLS